jgi:6-phosphogluconolactonase (cycloisomerase 2 family)
LDVDTSCTSLYVTGQHSQRGLAQFSINPQTGRPVRLNPPTVSTGGGPLSPRLDADDQFVYVPNSYYVQGFGWSVAQFSRNPETGRLTPLNPFLVSAEKNPTALQIDPSNRFVRVLTYNDGISSYWKDDRTGELRPLNLRPVQTGRNPWAMTFDASSTFAFVVSRSEAAVRRYRNEVQTGQLTELPSETPDPGWLTTNVIITDWHVSQAEQDMLAQAAKDSHFRSPRYGIFARLPDDEHHEWEFRLLGFTAAVGQELRTVPMVHATNQANPALRFVQYEDPVTGKWTAWEQVSTQ